jgi:hypothetical protein
MLLGADRIDIKFEPTKPGFDFIIPQNPTAQQP